MIIDHEHPHDDLGAYALGALSDEEAAHLEFHLATCERCREELARLRVAADALPRAVEPLEPPPELRRELLKAVRADSRGSSRAFSDWLGGWSLAPRIGWAAAAAAVVALVVVAATGGGSSARVLSAHVTIPGARAELVVPSGGAGATLRVSGFPQPARGHIYELWVQREGRVAPAGLFSVDTHGDGVGGIAQSLRGATAVMVTREVARGVTRPTSTPIVVSRA